MDGYSWGKSLRYLNNKTLLILSLKTESSGMRKNIQPWEVRWWSEKQKTNSVSAIK